MDYDLQTVEEYLKVNTDRALEVASSILGKNTDSQSFNGIVGAKNDIYDTDPNKFSNPEEYFDEWIKSHNKLFEKSKNCNYEKSVHRIHKLLLDTFLIKYIKMYLIRTWLRKHI